MNGEHDATPDSSPIHYVTIDQSHDALATARDVANERLTAELAEGSRMSRLVKNIWKGSAFKEYYQHKYTQQALRDIKQTDNILVSQASDDRSSNAKLATVNRFLQEGDDFIHEEAGEKRSELATDDELGRELKELIRKNIEGTLSDKNLLEERTRLLLAYRDTRSDIGDSVIRSDNILEVASAVRGAIEHGESIERVLDGMKISVGESRSGVRTEAQYNRVERIADKIGKTKAGSLIGPETVVTAATIAASVLRMGSHSVVSAATLSVAPGVAAGVWAGMRENKRMKDDRMQHSREMAQGKDFDDTSERRKAFEETRYHSASSRELTSILTDLFEAEAENLSDATRFDDALIALGSIEARIKLSDSRKIDLITYSSVDAVEEERLALDIARAQAKTVAESKLDAQMRTSLGLDPSFSLQQVLDQRSEAFLDVLEQDMSVRDRAFNKLKRRAVAKSAVIGGLTAMAVGTVAQEALAGVSDTREGLIEQLWNSSNRPLDGTMHQTLLNSLVNGTEGTELTDFHGPSSTYEEMAMGENGTLLFSDDQQINANQDGTLTFIGGNGDTLAEGIEANADGSLSQDTINELRAAGMIVEDKSYTVELPPVIESESVSLEEFVNQSGQTTEVTRDFWYNNDTAVFDQNELRLHWGGESGSGVNAAGEYQFSVANMTADGSFHDGQSVEWQQAAASGELKMAISASVDTQSEVFMLDINPDGTVDIPADSPVAEFFTSNDNGPVFNGQYAEVVQINGIDAEGVTHMKPLATAVGEGGAEGQLFTVTTETPATEFRPSYQITSPGYETVTVQDTYTEMAPAIPIVPRKSLEAMRSRQNGEFGYYAGNYQLSPEMERVRREETSPRLLANPDSDLNPHEELRWYRQKVEKSMGAGYLNDIDRAIESSTELRDLSPELKAIVKIPVNAAGEVESNNIYNILTHAYGDQDEESLSRTLILLHVNWFDDLMDNPEKRAAIEKTRAEIERARADRPQLKIATIETEWKREEVKNGVIGHVSRKLNDAALLAVERAVRQGKIATTQDILLIRNDADPKGMSRHYLKRYIETAEQQGRTDIFTGTTSFDNTKADRVPGLVLAGNFMQSLDLLAATRDNNVLTGGANFAVRASTFAAVGGIGFNPAESGAGSDDVTVGRRISAARRAKATGYTTGLSEYVRKIRRKSNSYADRSNGRHESNLPTRKIAQRVAGARIDTDSDREEVLYRHGVPIIHTWDGNAFSENGYADRTNGLLGEEYLKEDLSSDADTVVERIRNDMEGSVNVYSETIGRSGLAFLFAGAKGGPTSAYRLTRSLDGRIRLEFTDIGKQEIIKRLTRDSKGRFDAYGARKLRQMYGEASERARRQPTHRSMVRL